MNKIFTTKKLSWKIASLILAFLFWLFVINTQNPIQPQEISGINISIKGLDELESKGYELINKQEILDQNFKVVVNGPRLEIDKLVKNPVLISATLDLTRYIEDLTKDSVSEIAIYSVAINSDGNSVSVKDKHPQVNKLIIEKTDSKEQRVTYEMQDSITKHYTLIGDKKPVISPEKITIVGPKTELDRISEAKVIITSDDFSADQLVNQLPIILLDADGHEIKGLEMSTSTVEVKLPIGSQKTVPIHVDLQGKLHQGYELINTIVSPTEVTIVGRAETLKEIEDIKLKPIDLSAITKTDLLQVEMILPEGVISLGENTVSVSLQIEEESTLSYPIDMSDLKLKVQGLAEGMTYEILTPSINVVLSALPNKLLSYLTSDIKATINLNGYTEGQYSLPLVIVPPEGARVINSPINIDVSINKIKDIMDETPSPSPDIPEDGVLVPPEADSSETGESNIENDQ